MSKKAFLKNCRDLLKQGLTKQYLAECYDHIVKHEIKGRLNVSAIATLTFHV